MESTAKIVSVYCPECGKAYSTVCIDKLKKRGYCEICKTEYNDVTFRHIWSKWDDMYKHKRNIHDKWIDKGNICI